jgi:hypothetical protein
MTQSETLMAKGLPPHKFDYFIKLIYTSAHTIMGTITNRKLFEAM